MIQRQEANIVATCKQFRDLRIDAGLARWEVSQQSDLSEATIKNIEDGKSCREHNIAAAIRALNELYYNQMQQHLKASELIIRD